MHLCFACSQLLSLLHPYVTLMGQLLFPSFLPSSFISFPPFLPAFFGFFVGFFGGTRNLIQGPEHGRQRLYHLSHTPGSFCFSLVFETVPP
jgi:hypothetical protein